VPAGPCEYPPGFVTPSCAKGVCIIVNSKCYACNPARSDSECKEPWLWTGSVATDTYWMNEVSCEDGVPNAAEICPVPAPDDSSDTPGNATAILDGPEFGFTREATYQVFDMRGMVIRQGLGNANLKGLQPGVYGVRQGGSSKTVVVK
jgi:hypothetical protein